MHEHIKAEVEPRQHVQTWETALMVCVSCAFIHANVQDSSVRRHSILIYQKAFLVPAEALSLHLLSYLCTVSGEAYLYALLRCEFEF